MRQCECCSQEVRRVELPHLPHTGLPQGPRSQAIHALTHASIHSHAPAHCSASCSIVAMSKRKKWVGVPAAHGAVLPAGGSSTGSVNGYHTCKDLTEIQCDMSDVNQQYEGLGAALRGRLEQLSAMLEKMREAQDQVNAVLTWLEEKEQALKVLEASSSPTKSETMRAQAEHNKVLFSCIHKSL
ncbi:microtubule-actin cross-linking factor 1-like, partial [Pseudonaja textilis]|uniref:microtubule-actin cross-linking factor 1-like n=1 Tax=Pseudonaja textilis TaxID=8673 RepID=UPI000EAA1120